ncbi:MAG: class I SAM-dependent methyltransferase [Salinivirgaceae bacterium]|nr:class I SAM-dependent methyltransferase [Salinivirgaceae bacterium]
MWNKRYAQIEYVYGKEPNEFFKEQIQKLPNGKILLPAEGEGRNAVFAAQNNWQVEAFDSSSEAKNKAENLAKEKAVKLNYKISSFEEAKYEENTFDLIALIYAHSSNRQQNHQKLIKLLKPGGILLLEGFSKYQIKNSTGGPKSLDLLFSPQELTADFDELSEIELTETETYLSEGEHHLGRASIIRLIGKK